MVINLKKLIRFVLNWLNVCFPNLLPLLEIEIQKPQGKGWISQDIGFEVQMVLKFVPCSARVNLVCLDVGANIGDYSKALLGLIPTAQIHAFEPQPQLAANLEKTFHLWTNVSVHKIALGSIASQQSLFFDEPGSPLASLYQRTNLPRDIVFDKSILVDVSTIDLVCLSFGLKPNFIKIDVEGNELEVLRGAVNTLKKYEPVVQFEFGGTSIDSRTFFKDYWNYFHNIGYSIFRILPSGTRQIKSYSEREEVFTHMNFIASKTIA